MRPPETDRMFDRIPSPPHIGLRTFNVADVVGDLEPRSYTWRHGAVLNQGPAGYCVGFGWSGEASACPVAVSHVDNAYAIRLFKIARTKYDDRPLDSDDTDDGTYVLAGAKAAQEVGQLGEYRWATNLNDLLTALSHNGPVVLGLNWYAGMMDPDSDGYIHRTGRLVGGHCILAVGYNKRKGRVKLAQSWGEMWGEGGTCYLSQDDLGSLLADDGECCVPMRRLRPPA